MSALDLIRRCYVAGIVIGLNEDGGPRLTGRKPSPELLADLKEHRAEVIAALQEARVGEFDDLITGHTRRYVTPPDCLAANACACLGPCSRFLTLKPCAYKRGREA